MRYAQIRSMDISNGDGIGVALFVQGCHFHCENCFNSEAWDFSGGKEWNNNEYDNISKLLSRPYIKRLSILGGEPLADENLDDICNLIIKTKLDHPNIEIWLYTGYTYEYISNSFKTIYEEDNGTEFEIWNAYNRFYAMTNSDILVDGLYVDSLRDPKLQFRGSSNQRVIAVNDTITNGEITLWKQ